MTRPAFIFQHAAAILLAMNSVLCGGVSLSFADVFGYAFEPGPNVPEGFKPGPGVDATGLDLSGSRFVGMNLDGAKFDGCNLRNTEFIQVGCANGAASFRGADLRRSVFRECDFGAGSTFDDAVISGSNWAEECRTLTVDQIRSSRSYKCRDLSGFTIGAVRSFKEDGSAEHPEITLDLRGFDLRGAVFQYGDFRSSDLDDADLRSAKFRYALIRPQQLSSLRSPRYEVGDFLGAASFRWRGAAAPWSGMVFIGVDMRGWSFAGQSLRDAAFVDVDLRDADFTNADVRGASFIRSLSPEQLRSTVSYKRGDLTGLRLVQLNQSPLAFDGMDLSEQTLAGASLCIDAENVELTDAVITGINMKGSTHLTVEQIKSTWNFKHDRMDTVILPKSVAAGLAE